MKGAIGLCCLLVLLVPALEHAFSEADRSPIALWQGREAGIFQQYAAEMQVARPVGQP